MKDLVRRRMAGPLGRSIAAGRFPDIFSEFNNMLNDFWNDHNWEARIFEEIQPKGRFPKVDVKSLADKYVVDIAAAGFDKKDIELELRDNCLLIKAEKAIEDENSDGEYIYREIARRSFSRVVRFPEKVDIGNIDCKYENGIVSCSIGKLETEDKKDIIKIKID
jgi:HSP20 family protein